jgi:hypothetical protein
MRLFYKILACVILAYVLAAYTSIPANPEIKFWHNVDQLRNREIAAVRLSQPAKSIVFFTGGSSCAFSIDPEIIENRCGMPAFNLGLPISGGPKYLLHQALEKTRKGDILVVILEPDTLTYTYSYKPSQFGFAMAVSDKDPAAAGGGSSFDASLGLRDYLNLSRPGPNYFAVWLAKALTTKKYRYQDSDIRYHGRIETPVTDPALPRASRKSVTQLCPTGRALLTTLQQVAAAKGVSLLYSMPWLLNAEDSAEHNRTANLKILESINSVIPVIDDGFQGVATDPTHFSDSGLHLSFTGSVLRSNALADSLNKRLCLPAPEK